MAPVMSSQMGSRSSAPEEEPSQPIDESIFLTREQIKVMSEEQIQQHLQKLNEIRSTPRVAKQPKVTAQGTKKVRDRGVI